MLSTRDLSGPPNGVNSFFEKDYETIRILCVDDNRDLADSYQIMLRMNGYDVKACYDGFQALEVVRSFMPHVCILDLNMPGMAGDELARKITSQLPEDPPFMIAITAMSGELYRVLTKVAGFHVHLVKPVQPSELIRIVEANINSRFLNQNKRTTKIDF